jgi:hypothetical protein
MRPRWILSKFFRDPQSNLVPVASAYGQKYRVPMNPATDDDFALVEIWAGAHQLDAAKQDDRLIVCPYLFDPSALTQTVIDAYATYGAKPGMSMGLLLATLCEVEPIYGHTL